MSRDFKKGSQCSAEFIHDIARCYGQHRRCTGFAGKQDSTSTPCEHYRYGQCKGPEKGAE